MRAQGQGLWGGDGEGEDDDHLKALGLGVGLVGGRSGGALSAGTGRVKADVSRAASHPEFGAEPAFGKVLSFGSAGTSSALPELA